MCAGIKAYSPDTIRGTLKLDSLIPFAFALTQNPQDNANVLIRTARGIDAKSEEYLTFSKRYIIDAIDPTISSETTQLPLSLQALDVRVSEFVDQALAGSTKPFVYLPLLVEDPNHASAWSMGQDIRKLAYSLLAPSATTSEHRRKAQSIAVQEYNNFSANDLNVPISEIERQVSALAAWARSKSITSELLWPLFALSLVLAELNTPPPVTLVLRVLNADFDNTWDFIHLTARIQAAMYSLRMLKQITSVRLAMRDSLSTVDTCQEPLVKLAKQMEAFPAIEAMFTVPGQTKKVLAEHEKLKALVEEIYTSGGVEVPREQVSNKKKKRQAREAERKKRKVGQKW